MDYLSYGTAIDTSGFEKGLKEMEQKMAEIGKSAITQSENLSKSFSDIPKVDIEFVVNASKSIDTIGDAFNEIDRIVDTNKTAIRDMQGELERLMSAKPAGDASEWESQCDALKENIQLREAVIQSAGESADALAATEQRLMAEAEAFSTNGATIREKISSLGDACSEHETALARLASETDRVNAEMAAAFMSGNDKEYSALNQKLDALRKETAERKKSLSEIRSQTDGYEKAALAMEKDTEAKRKNEEKTNTLSQRIRQLKTEMADLAQANGMVKTDRYNELERELGRLYDIRADIQKQGRVFSDDNARLTGLMNGIQGIAGGFSAAQGAMALFSEENEDLQRIMLKVQSAMAITTGLQQLANTLNKDSAFTLVYLNKIKEVTASLLGKSVAVQRAETRAAVEGAAAHTANATATAAGTAAAKAHATATTLATRATNLLKLAMAALPFAAIATAVGLLVSKVSEYVDGIKEARKRQREFFEFQADGEKAFGEASLTLDLYMRRVEMFCGSMQDEARLVSELNRKLGTEFGTYKTLADWKQTLTEKSRAYTEAIRREAEAEAMNRKAAELTEENVDLTRSLKDGTADDEAKVRKRIEENKRQISEYIRMYQTAMERADFIRTRNGLDRTEAVEDATAKAVKAKTGDDDRSAAARRLESAKEAEAEYQRQVGEFVKENEGKISQWRIEAMKDGLAKELAQIGASAEREKEELTERLRQVAMANKEATKAAFLAKPGATEDAWTRSKDGRKTDMEWLDELAKDRNVGKSYADGMARIERNAQEAMANVREEYSADLIERFGTTEQKIEAVNKKWMSTISELPAEMIAEAERQWNEELTQLNDAEFRLRVNFDTTDTGAMSAAAMSIRRKQLQDFLDANFETMNRATIGAYQSQISSFDDAIAERNPFTAMRRAMEELTRAKADFETACREMAAAQDEVSDAEAKYGKTSNEAKQAREALTNAENRAAEASNRIRQSAISLSASISTINTKYKELAGRSESLAEAVGHSFSKELKAAIGVMGELGDMTATLVDQLGDMTMKTAGAITEVVDASAKGIEATAATASTAVSTLEKASVILTVISAVITAATYIAEAMNGDDDKQDSIERANREIRALEWQMANRQAEKASYRLDGAYKEQIGARMGEVERMTREIERLFESGRHMTREQAEAINDTANQIEYNIHEARARAAASLNFSDTTYTDFDYLKDGANDLYNLSAEIENIQGQIEDERDKKETDYGAIEEMERNIAEKKLQLATAINERVEYIIGGTADDISARLGDAIVEAFQSGEDAAEAWGEAVDSIISDMLKRTMVAEFLTPQVMSAFDKFKRGVFDEQGKFYGTDAITKSSLSLGEDLERAGADFSELMGALPQELREYFIGDAERQGVSRGIATASQDSVDENNARLTTIQGHTYTLVQGQQELNGTAGRMLEHIAGIEANTSETGRLVRQLRNTVEDISARGLALR